MGGPNAVLFGAAAGSWSLMCVRVQRLRRMPRPRVPKASVSFLLTLDGRCACALTRNEAEQLQPSSIKPAHVHIVFSRTNM